MYAIKKWSNWGFLNWNYSSGPVRGQLWGHKELPGELVVRGSTLRKCGKLPQIGLMVWFYKLVTPAIYGWNKDCHTYRAGDTQLFSQSSVLELEGTNNRSNIE